MSDDSYMYVFPVGVAGFAVENRSASCRYGRDPKKPRGFTARIFNTIQEAMDYAHAEGYNCEYGVSVSPKLKLVTTYGIAP